MNDHGVTSRALREPDWSRVRDLLVELERVAPPGHAWEVRRWDGWRWYRPDPAWDPRWEREARIWEASDGRIVGAAHREGRRFAALQVHPAYRRLEAEMIAWVEAEIASAVRVDLTAAGADDDRHVSMAVRDYDLHRRRLLEGRSWRETSEWELTYRMSIGPDAVVQRPMSPGYRTRPMRPGDPDDAARLADLLNAAFARTQHAAPEWLVFERMAPDYDPRLHLVGEAPDGSFAAHVGVTHEPTAHLAIVEPVCTHPDHRRLGLAESLLRAGLERARLAGARRACVDTGDEPDANRFYAAIGFTEAYLAHMWEWRG